MSIEYQALFVHIERIIERSNAIVPALRAYAQEISLGRLKHELNVIVRVLEAGNATEATATLETLPEYWLPLLSAISTSEDPGLVLQEFVDEAQRNEDVRRQQWQSLAYPILVSCVAVLVLTALSLFVIPTFRAIFGDFGIDLPGLTLFVLNAAHWLANGSVFIVLGIIVLLLLLVRWKRRLRPVRHTWKKNSFTLPFSRRSALARLAYFLAELLDSGLQVQDALRVAGFAVGWRRLRTDVWALASVYGTNSPQSQLGQSVTATLRHILFADMPSASRARLLREVGSCYAERTRRTPWWGRGLLEPLAIGAIGLVVGVVVLALFLPLVKLITSLST